MRSPDPDGHDMITSSEFVKSARSFVEEQSQVFAAQYLRVKDKYEANEYVQTVGRLLSALYLTTQSILLLAEHEQVWDLSILFRSILEGSARALYLIAAPSREEAWRRVDEYDNILLKSEMASLEQSINRMVELTKEEDSVDAKTSKISKDIMQEWKTGEGESRQVREVVRKWNFWNVSRALRKECRSWAMSADTWELRYATANVLVHKSSVGNKHLMESYRSIRDGENFPLFSAATIIEGCVVLQFDRTFLFSRRLDLDSAAIIDVKARHEDFFEMLSSIRAESESVLEKQLEDQL